MKKIELFGGILTFLISLFAWAFVLVPKGGSDLGEISLYLGSPLLILVGSWFHVFRRRTLGLLILLLSGSILIAILTMAALGGAIAYRYPLRQGLLVLAPLPFAVITMITGLLMTLKRRRPVEI